jgi:Radical SAM superfamily/Iron-sulfur cluster-binding domain
VQPLIFPIFLDYKCNYECGHCSVGSSPRTKFPIDEDLVFSYISQIAELPTAAGVVFTGGEPTLRKDLLLRAIASAEERGLMTRVVTNAWWARTPTKAEQFVEDLRRAGLQELNTSWDGFHAEFGSLDNVANAVAAGLEAGMRVSVGIVETQEGGSHKQALVAAVADRLGKTKEELRLMPLYVLVDFPAKVGAAESLDLTGVRAGERVFTGCTEVGTTLSLHPDGTVRGCCGHAVFYTPDLVLGDLRTTRLEDIVEGAQGNIVYWWLRSQGPAGILRTLGADVGDATHICDACSTLFRDHRQELVDYARANKEAILAESVMSGHMVTGPVRVALSRKEKLMSTATDLTETPA